MTPYFGPKKHNTFTTGWYWYRKNTTVGQHCGISLKFEASFWNKNMQNFEETGEFNTRHKIDVAQLDSCSWVHVTPITIHKLRHRKLILNKFSKNYIPVQVLSPRHIALGCKKTTFKFQYYVPRSNIQDQLNASTICDLDDTLWLELVNHIEESSRSWCIVASSFCLERILYPLCGTCFYA